MATETINFHLYHLHSELGARVPRDVVRVKVHPSVASIPSWAFRGCAELEEVELPEGLAGIGAGAFWGCGSMANVAFPSTIRKIGEHAFCRCYKLEAVRLPEGLAEIEHHAFYYCSRLKRINIPSSVAAVPACAFMDCGQLEEVSLCSGLAKIGERAFQRCHSLKHIHFPPSLERIDRGAFVECNCLEVMNALPGAMEGVGAGAFGRTRLQRLRMPPSVAEVPSFGFSSYQCMFSLELPEGVGRLGWGAFKDCYSLRNVAIPILDGACLDAEFSHLDGAADLVKLFGSSGAARRALTKRFDGLPIHKLCYYQSYHRDALEQLHIALIEAHNRDTRSTFLAGTLWSKPSLSDEQQDCLGMTPLHILACSATPRLELYQIIVEKYPNSLVTEDRWGDVPIFYAIWGNAPETVIRFLATRQKRAFPDHQLHIEKMLVTLTMANAPTYVFRNLLDVHRIHFGEREIDWKYVFEALADVASMVRRRCDYISDDIPPFLLRNCLSERVDAIGVKRWRNAIARRIQAASCMFSSAPFVSYSVFRQNILVCRYVASFEHEYKKMNEATSLLELALWKARVEDMNSSNGTEGQGIDLTMRQGCRIDCGAAVVIPNVFPFLIPACSQFSSPVKDEEEKVEDVLPTTDMISGDHGGDDDVDIDSDY